MEEEKIRAILGHKEEVKKEISIEKMTPWKTQTEEGGEEAVATKFMWENEKGPHHRDQAKFQQSIWEKLQGFQRHTCLQLRDPGCFSSSPTHLFFKCACKAHYLLFSIIIIFTYPRNFSTLFLPHFWLHIHQKGIKMTRSAGNDVL